MRAAGRLLVAAWIFGLLALGALLFEDEWIAPILVMTIGLACWLFSKDETIEVRAAAPRGDRMPSDILDLLALIDNLIDALERGEDAGVDVDLGRLGLALVRLRPVGRGYLEQRGADPIRMRTRVCRSNLVAKAGPELSPDRRRALHHDLVQFAATTRGRSCGDPYRSRIGVSLGSLGALRDPTLARTWRRFCVILSLLVAAWAVAWISAEIMAKGPRPNWCAPIVHRGCVISFDEIFVNSSGALGFAFVPMVLLSAATAARAAAWRSWTAALPKSESASMDASFAGLRCVLKWGRRMLRTLPWLGSLFGIGALVEFCGIPLHRDEVLLVIVFVTLSLLVIPELVSKLGRRARLRQFRRRLRRARADQRDLLTDLFALRHGLADAAPARAELLEQLADTLAEAESLGQLGREDRDRVVAQLRAATQRGPALPRAQRDRLLLDVEICERLIARSEGA